MNKLIRMFNQNRRAVIVIIFIIALIIIIIQTLNSIIEEKNDEVSRNNLNNTNSSTNENSTTISKNNVSVITEEEVKSNISDTKIIEEFVEYCNKKDTEKAYNMLTDDCKNLMFQNINKFKTGYIDRIFYIDRLYTLENWFQTTNLNTYYIKYIEDILSTGNATSNNNIGDYITVTKNR